MTSVTEIESAITRLSSEELNVFRTWFRDFDAEIWDREMEQDIAAGRLDRFADEALADLRSGRCSDL